MQTRNRLAAVVAAGVMALAWAVSAHAGDAVPVNINTASMEELTQLSGVGETHAAGIIAFREQNGPFKSPEEITGVSGIGQKTFERNRALIVVEEPGKKMPKK